MSDGRPDEGLLRELADELGMATDAATVSEVLSYGRELDEAFADAMNVPAEPTESAGARSDDEYNALLAVYDEPARQMRVACSTACRSP